MFALKKEEIEYLRDLAMAQLKVSEEEGLKRFKEYQLEMFPWVQTAKKREDEKYTAFLKKEIGKGPIQISAAPSSKKNRMITRKPKEKPRTFTAEEQKARNQFYQRLGKDTQL